MPDVAPALLSLSLVSPHLFADHSYETPPSRQTKERQQPSRLSSSQQQMSQLAAWAQRKSFFFFGFAFYMFNHSVRPRLSPSLFTAAFWADWASCVPSCVAWAGPSHGSRHSVFSPPTLMNNIEINGCEVHHAVAAPYCQRYSSGPWPFVGEMQFGEGTRLALPATD